MLLNRRVLMPLVVVIALLKILQLSQLSDEVVRDLPMTGITLPNNNMSTLLNGFNMRA